MDRHIKVRVDNIKVTSGNWFVIENALSRLGLFINLHLFWLFLSFNKDINPDFVSKSIVVTSYHTEISRVSSWFLRSVTRKSPGVFSLRFNNAFNSSRLDLEFITIGLNEDGILGPGGLSIVSECPLLSEWHSTGNRKLVTETLLDKSTRVLDKLGLFRVFLGYETTSLIFSDFLLSFLFLHLHGGHLRSTINRVELTKERVRSMRWMTDLQERVLISDALSFTVLA
jgi:hypothetical protein